MAFFAFMILVAMGLQSAGMLKTAITSVLAADLFDPRHLWSMKLRIKLLFAIAEVHRLHMKRSNKGRSLVQEQRL